MDVVLVQQPCSVMHISNLWIYTLFLGGITEAEGADFWTFHLAASLQQQAVLA